MEENVIKEVNNNNPNVESKQTVVENQDSNKSEDKSDNVEDDHIGGLFFSEECLFYISFRRRNANLHILHII